MDLWAGTGGKTEKKKRQGMKFLISISQLFTCMGQLLTGQETKVATYWGLASSGGAAQCGGAGLRKYEQPVTWVACALRIDGELNQWPHDGLLR